MVNQHCSGAVGALSELKAGEKVGREAAACHLPLNKFEKSLGELWEQVQKVGHV